MPLAWQTALFLPSEGSFYLYFEPPHPQKKTHRHSHRCGNNTCDEMDPFFLVFRSFSCHHTPPPHPHDSFHFIPRLSLDASPPMWRAFSVSPQKYHKHHQTHLFRERQFPQITRCTSAAAAAAADNGRVRNMTAPKTPRIRPSRYFPSICGLSPFRAGKQFMEHFNAYSHATKYMMKKKQQQLWTLF